MSLILVERHPSTEHPDCGYWEQYQLISSLQEYVLVGQTAPRVEIFRRLTSDSWEYLHVREGLVQLASGPALNLSTLYADLPH